MNLDDAIAEIKREIKMRQEVYPKWINQGKISSKLADHRLKTMLYTLATLEELRKTNPPDTCAVSQIALF